MRTVFILVLICTLTIIGSAQQLSISRSEDTLSLRDLVFPATDNPLWQSQRFLSINPSDSAEMAGLPPGYLRTEILSLPPQFDEHFDLSSSLQLQWNNQDQYQLLHSALGYMFFGGEVYMMYRALRKNRYIY